MLTWNVTYHCKKGQRAAFYEALCKLGIRKNSRAEEGNRRYDYYFAAEAPDDLLKVAGKAKSSLIKTDFSCFPASFYGIMCKHEA